MKEYLPMMVGIVVASILFVVAWRRGAFLKLSGYWRDTAEELKKCTWPTREELMGSTIVVLVAVALLGGYTMGVDFVIANLVRILV